MKTEMNLLERFLLAIMTVVAAIGISVLSGILCGTVLYFIWPIVVGNLLPGLVESGIIAGHADWWACVCFMFFVWVLKTKSSSK